MIWDPKLDIQHPNTPNTASSNQKHFDFEPTFERKGSLNGFNQPLTMNKAQSANNKEPVHRISTGGFYSSSAGNSNNIQPSSGSIQTTKINGIALTDLFGPPIPKPDFRNYLDTQQVQSPRNQPPNQNTTQLPKPNILSHTYSNSPKNAPTTGYFNQPFNPGLLHNLPNNNHLHGALLTPQLHGRHISLLSPAPQHPGHGTQAVQQPRRQLSRQDSDSILSEAAIDFFPTQL